MAAPRRSAIRGSVARGESTKARTVRNAPLGPVEVVKDPAAPRSVIDFGLQRHNALHTLFNGGALSSDFCDADTYLLRAAKHHGEETGTACPACRTEGLVHVTYVYGDQLGPYSGRIRGADDLPGMSHKFGEFKVYVVEVCQRCHWNFLTTTFVLGDGVPRRALPTPRDLLD